MLNISCPAFFSNFYPIYIYVNLGHSSCKHVENNADPDQTDSSDRSQPDMHALIQIVLAEGVLH